MGTYDSKSSRSAIAKLNNSVDLFADMFSIDKEAYKRSPAVQFIFDDSLTQQQADQIIKQDFLAIQDAAAHGGNYGNVPARSLISKKDIKLWAAYAQSDKTHGNEAEVYLEEKKAEDYKNSALKEIVLQFYNEPLLIPLFLVILYAALLATKQLLNKNLVAKGITGGVGKGLAYNLNSGADLIKRGYNAIKKRS